MCWQWDLVREELVLSGRQIITKLSQQKLSKTNQTAAGQYADCVESVITLTREATEFLSDKVDMCSGISAVSSTVITVCIMFVFPSARFLSSLFSTCFLTGSDSGFSVHREAGKWTQEWAEPGVNVSVRHRRRGLTDHTFQSNSQSQVIKRSHNQYFIKSS